MKLRQIFYILFSCLSTTCYSQTNEVLIVNSMDFDGYRMIRNDTLSLCSELSANDLFVIYNDTYITDTACNCIDTLLRYIVNGEERKANFINDLDLITGDRIYIKHLSGERICTYYDYDGVVEQKLIFPNEVRTRELYVQVINNEILGRVFSENNDTVLCENEELKLHVNEEISFDNWIHIPVKHYPMLEYGGANTLTNYGNWGRTSDSNTVRKVGRYFVAEEEWWRTEFGACPRISEPIDIYENQNCIVNTVNIRGYVTDSIRNLPLKEIDLSLNNGVSVFTDDNGYYEFIVNKDQCLEYITASRDSFSVIVPIPRNNFFLYFPVPDSFEIDIKLKPEIINGINTSEIMKDDRIIYPNPFKNEIFQSLGIVDLLHVYNTNGVKVLELENINFGRAIDVSFLGRGLYYYIINADKASYTGYIIKD